MVPLDASRFRRDVARLFREAPGALSLLIHGNDHLRHELMSTSQQRANALLAQALRRTADFERRSGVPVSSVMTAPHEQCSRVAMRAMFRLGFEGVSLDWRYPWQGRQGTEHLLGGFGQAEMLAGGLPVLTRDHLAQPKEDLVFRAFLDQPILLYCHHQDLSDGTGALAAAAAEINRLGAVEWLSPSSIARTNFRHRLEASALVVQMASRRISIDVPEGVDALRLETHPVHLGSGGARARINGREYPIASSPPGWRSEAVPVPPGETVTVALEAPSPLDPRSISAPRTRVWPVLRRKLAESRDRIQPTAHRLPRPTRPTGVTPQAER